MQSACNTAAGRKRMTGVKLKLRLVKQMGRGFLLQTQWTGNGNRRQFLTLQEKHLFIICNTQPRCATRIHSLYNTQPDRPLLRTHTHSPAGLISHRLQVPALLKMMYAAVCKLKMTSHSHTQRPTEAAAPLNTKDITARPSRGITSSSHQWSNKFCDLVLTCRSSSPVYSPGLSCCVPVRQEKAPVQRSASPRRLFIAPVLWLFSSLIHTQPISSHLHQSLLWSYAAHSSLRLKTTAPPGPRGWTINTGLGIKGQAFRSEDNLSNSGEHRPLPALQWPGSVHDENRLKADEMLTWTN